MLRRVLQDGQHRRRLHPRRGLRQHDGGPGLGGGGGPPSLARRLGRDGGLARRRGRGAGGLRAFRAEENRPRTSGLRHILPGENFCSSGTYVLLNTDILHYFSMMSNLREKGIYYDSEFD